MRPLISVLSVIGRGSAVMTPTAGGAPGLTCAIADVTNRNVPATVMVRSDRDACMGGALCDQAGKMGWLWTMMEAAKARPNPCQPALGRILCDSVFHGTGHVCTVID